MKPRRRFAPQPIVTPLGNGRARVVAVGCLGFEVGCEIVVPLDPWARETVESARTLARTSGCEVRDVLAAVDRAFVAEVAREAVAA